MVPVGLGPGEVLGRMDATNAEPEALPPAAPSVPSLITEDTCRAWSRVTAAAPTCEGCAVGRRPTGWFRRHGHRRRRRPLDGRPVARQPDHVAVAHVTVVDHEQEHRGEDLGGGDERDEDAKPSTEAQRSVSTSRAMTGPSPSRCPPPNLRLRPAARQGERVLFGAGQRTRRPRNRTRACGALGAILITVFGWSYPPLTCSPYLPSDLTFAEREDTRCRDRKRTTAISGFARSRRPPGSSPVPASCSWVRSPRSSPVVHRVTRRRRPTRSRARSNRGWTRRAAQSPSAVPNDPVANAPIPQAHTRSRGS